MKKGILKKPPAFYDTFYRKPSREKKSTTYCPGCGHGIIHKLIAEALSDLDMYEKTTFISPVGCSVFAYYYFKCGNIQAAHGRAPAVATGIKRAHPESYVISYQGDGDLAAIGTAEIIHAANRGENITVIFVNNAIYGMTGGQMAPTTVIGQKTTTSPCGRSVSNEGFPIKITEMLSTIDAPVFVARSSIHNIKNIMTTRNYIQKALTAQKERKGFTFVEILAQCPTNWKIQPSDANKWIEEHLLPVFKTGIFKDITEEAQPKEVTKMTIPPSRVKKRIGYGAEKQVQSKRVLSLIPLEKELNVKVAGFGGQGVLSFGIFLCELAMLRKYYSTWLPSYGPEMRGGTANCTVVLSNKKIGNPAFSDIDVLVAMNSVSFDKFTLMVKKNGIILYNSSIVTRISKSLKDLIKKRKIRMIPIRASHIAEKAGSVKTANTVMLGKMMKEYPYFSEHDVFIKLKEKFSKNQKIIDINKKAFTEGYTD
ncbi:2-oxoacid:acceptor oxidoreductase family protein [Spirochaetota bacterium]